MTLKRFPHCKISQDNGTWVTENGQITVNGESPAARVAVYDWNADRASFGQIDRLENCELVEYDDGKVTIHGDSQYLAQNQGVAVRVKLDVTPGRRGCANCS